LQEQEKFLEELNVQIAVVTFEAGFLARAYAEDAGLKWPLLVDEDRFLYHGYGMLKASFLELVGPATWWVYLKEILWGKWPKKASGDVSQRGGDVLIDPDGVVRLHHIGRSPADRPAVKSILETVQGSARKS